MELEAKPREDVFLLPPLDWADASVIKVPAGKALVQSVDFFTPIVNNPYWFGQIAAANSLSDIYALGGEPYAVMNLVCFPIKTMPKEVLKEILRGGLAKIEEAGAALAGGHSVEDEEIKYGLAVTGLVEPDNFASNKGLQPGDFLLLTKPIGTGVLATALKGEIGEEEFIEKLLFELCSKLNKIGGEAIKRFGLKAATDVTGFGLGGHLLEMARASRVGVELWSNKVPLLEPALEMAGMGLIPAGSYANKHFCSQLVEIKGKVNDLTLDLLFDAQTSGGLILGVNASLLDQVLAFFEQNREQVAVIGKAVSLKEKYLTIL
ncbi:MAG: selenide, water dikinase [Desulfonauticus sp.]|nr:selenide, water dikinase [Desulfonauticus sp.]